MESKKERRVKEWCATLWKDTRLNRRKDKREKRKRDLNKNSWSLNRDVTRQQI